MKTVAICQMHSHVRGTCTLDAFFSLRVPVCGVGTKYRLYILQLVPTFNTRDFFYNLVSGVTVNSSSFEHHVGDQVVVESSFWSGLTSDGASCPFY